MASKTQVDYDVDLLKVYLVGGTDVCVAMQDMVSRKCIDQYYPLDQLAASVIPGVVDGIAWARSRQPGDKVKRSVVITVVNPKDEPIERCHMRPNDAEKMLSRMKEILAGHVVPVG